LFHGFAKVAFSKEYLSRNFDEHGRVASRFITNLRRPQVGKRTQKGKNVNQPLPTCAQKVKIDLQQPMSQVDFCSTCDRRKSKKNKQNGEMKNEKIPEIWS